MKKSPIRKHKDRKLKQEEIEIREFEKLHNVKITRSNRGWVITRDEDAEKISKNLEEKGWHILSRLNSV